jgi:hypothetical protein
MLFIPITRQFFLKIHLTTTKMINSFCPLHFPPNCAIKETQKSRTALEHGLVSAPEAAAADHQAGHRLRLK